MKCQYQNQIDCILCSQRWRSSIQSAKTRLVADCGSDHELLIAKFRLILKKVGKTTRPFMYDLNQIPYDYTVEVTNRFKGLDLIEYELKNYAWRTMDGGSWHCTGGRDQDQSQGKEMQEGKIVVWGGLTNSWEKKREAKGKGEKERYSHLNAEFQRIARRSKKVFLSDQCRKMEENNRMGKTRDLVKKIRDAKGTFHAKMGTIKDRNGMDQTEAEDSKKRWQEYTEEMYKKHLHDWDNHNGVITHLEPDILEWKVKWD